VGKKATNHESLLKTQEVYGFLTSGHSRGNIVRTLSEQWGCSERQVDNYIAKARTMLERDCEMARPAFLAECLGGIREVRQKAEACNNHGVALACIKLQAELVGLIGKS
jgi:hypothetical protein